MIARVTLEIALRREFDYLVPSEMEGQVEVGTRVKVPFGPRQVMGVVTLVLDDSPHTNLRAIAKVIGKQSLVTPKVLQLARWIGEYYCCAPEIALKSVLPEAVRKEQEGWRERLVVRLLQIHGEPPKLSKRQQDLINVIEEWREIPLQKLVELAGTTPDTIRRLEDKGLVVIENQISERDPYEHENILPTDKLTLNAEQEKALAAINGALDQCAAGFQPAVGAGGRSQALPKETEEELLVGSKLKGGNSVQESCASADAADCRLESGSTGSRASSEAQNEDTESLFFDPKAEKGGHRGALPHWRQGAKLYFVTFRLEDSVAQQQLQVWQEEKTVWESFHPKPWSEKTQAEYSRRFTSRMEDLLDAGYGSCALAESRVGEVVENALKHFDGDRYSLGDYVVMPNHVHVLLQPGDGVELSDILYSWKSFTAKEINRILNRKGMFWRDESFDHIVRSGAQWAKFKRYIQDNPVKARLKSGFKIGKGNLVDIGDVIQLTENKGAAKQSAAGFQPAVGTGGRNQALPKETEGELLVGPKPKGGKTVQESRDSANVADCRLESGSTGLPASSNQGPTTFLLHGVTGSGKTEVYLQALAHTLEQGKGAIVLVPEISLTPQTVERFKARFSSGKCQTLVAVLHSHLSSGERHDEWHKIRQGRARIVIGARSAIFAPVDPLGLIIVDEEHEYSYKQEEAPRYHARDVAVYRGQMEGAVVVLGSATPSMESYYNVKRGKYQLLEMPTRADDKKMPIVRVIDMRSEAKKEKGIPIFSNRLKEAMHQRLEKKEQTILFLNRRGYSSSLQCPKCGYVAQCPHCSVSLTYHRRAQELRCHICGHFAPAPARCPNNECRDPAIRYAGLGTEKVEETLGKLFPNASIRRMDSDTLKRKEDYRTILGEFRRGKIDILVGTQMIAKGLHFPNVTLVGIIYADLGLHLADFRAGERTFQLLTQVSGRAGRGDVEGEVVVQAFTPFHPAIQYARRHDYIGFYEQEIEFREQLKYPPLSRVALLTMKGRNEDKVQFSADHLRKQLETKFKGWSDLVIAGPAPAPLARAETFYRYQIMLRTKAMSKLSKMLAEMLENQEWPDDITVAVDIDPVDLI
ncbi:MAG TPA: primosomal protein N' [Verrucomicrobiae bacterium]